MSARESGYSLKRTKQKREILFPSESMEAVRLVVAARQVMPLICSIVTRMNVVTNSVETIA